MKVIFPKSTSGILFSRSIKKNVKQEVEQVINKQLGRHVSSLKAILVTHPENPKRNGYAIYTELSEDKPENFFLENIHWGQNYFFGVIQTKRSNQTFFFLAEISEPLCVGQDKVILDEVKTIKVFVNH